MQDGVTDGAGRDRLRGMHTLNSQSSASAVEAVPSKLFVGVDVGGTFTDVVKLETASGRISVAKVPSTTGDYSAGFLQGLARLDITGPSIARLLHGTTVATNAAIER